MKPNAGILFLTLFLIVITSNCDIIENVYGRVRNTTGAIKNDLRSWWSYGKGVVFGNTNDLENPEIDVRVGEEHKGVIGRVYGTLESGVHAVWKGVHDMVIGDTTKKGVIGNLYDRVRNRLTRIKTHITGDRKGSNDIYQNFTATKETKPIREALNQFLFGNKSWNLNGDVVKPMNDNNTENLKIDIRNFGEKGLTINNDVDNRIEETKDTIQRTLTNVTNNVTNLVTDAVDSGKKLVESETSKIEDKGTSLNNKIKESADDMKKLSYDG